MALNLPNLCWSVAMGIHLSLDLSGAAMRANASWLAVVGGFQRVLLSRFADYQVGLFGAWNGTSNSLLLTRFDGTPLLPAFSSFYDAVWNSVNSSGAAFEVSFAGADGPSVFQIPPLGCAVTGGNASEGVGLDVFGGVFEGLYNGVPLTPGLHVITEDRTCIVQGVAALCVAHPWGLDTELTVALPLSWQGSPVVVMALNATLGVISLVPSNVSGAFVAFNYSGLVSGVEVNQYSIQK